MADRNFPSVRIKNYEYDCVLISGSFCATGAGITAGTINGGGYGVAWNAAGNYTITLADQFRHCIGFGSHLGLTTPNVDLVTNCGIPVVAPGAAATMDVFAFDTATATAADPAVATDRISFWMLLSNSYLDAVN